MAWVNCAIDGITTGTIADGSTKMYQYFTYSAPSSGVIPSDLNYTVSYTQTQLNNISYNTFLVGDGTNGGIKVGKYNGRHGVYIAGYYNYQQWNSNLYDANGDDCCIFAAINEETQRGTIFGFARWRNDRWAITDASCFNSEGIYHFLKNIQQILYNWQSVPNISGKNGILSLVTLDSESINDGEPVSGAAISVFDQNPASGNNVKDIVDGNTPLIPSAVDVTATFIISNPPVGELASRILAAKKDSIPESIEDADKTVSIPANASDVTMPGLDENSQYYFAIFVADATGDTAVSDPKDIYTSGDEGYNFEYTGEIVEWTVPKTGIYSLETWGAQGGNATDGTNSARGGYGAYAVGEVFLTQGDILYINVGGQNGYGGGGNYIPPDHWTEVAPDANGYVLNASANANGFFDSVSNRQMIIDEGNFDNFTYDTTNNWITFGSGCDCWFDFYSYIKPEVLQNATQLDIEVEGYYDQTCSSSNSKYLVRLMLMDEDNTSASDNNIFMDNVFVRDGQTYAQAMRILNTSNSYIVPTDVGDQGCVIFDGNYTHWQNKEEVITYRFAISNGTITFISQHCTQGVGAGTRIRSANQNIPMALTSGHKLKIKCGTCQGFHARAYRIKVTQ